MHVPSLVDFLRGGWGISLCVAIDYTASNMEPTNPSSLHYLSEFNQYEMAIHSVGRILEAYDSDNLIPVYGFGAIPRYMNEVNTNHCFPLNGVYPNPEVQGVNGILGCYRSTLHNIKFSGPTYFAPILKQMIQIVRLRLQEMSYHVFLILTDGEIHDMMETKDLVVEASELPMSIIIIGVGKEKFKLMKELDSDKQILRSSSGKAAQRDIVQFVKFKKFA